MPTVYNVICDSLFLSTVVNFYFPDQLFLKKSSVFNFIGQNYIPTRMFSQNERAKVAGTRLQDFANLWKDPFIMQAEHMHAFHCHLDYMTTNGYKGVVIIILEKQ